MNSRITFASANCGPRIFYRNVTIDKPHFDISLLISQLRTLGLQDNLDSSTELNAAVSEASAFVAKSWGRRRVLRYFSYTIVTISSTASDNL